MGTAITALRWVLERALVACPGVLPVPVTCGYALLRIAAWMERNVPEAVSYLNTKRGPSRTPLVCYLVSPTTHRTSDARPTSGGGGGGDDAGDGHRGHCRSPHGH